MEHESYNSEEERLAADNFNATQAAKISNEDEVGELSPEIIQAIMDKVKDINKVGNAFSVVNNKYPLPDLDNGENKLDSILKHGLIGTTPDQEGMNGGTFFNKTNAKTYVGLLKQHKRPEVFFSIIGRTVGDRTRRLGKDIKTNASKVDEYGSLFGLDDNTIAVMFDLKAFSGEYGSKPLIRGEDQVDTHTFRPHNGGNPFNRSQQNDHGLTTHQDYGFILSPRVPSRLFEGIIFQMQRELTSEEYNARIARVLAENTANSGSLSYEKDEEFLRRQKPYHYVEEIDPQALRARAEEIAEKMIMVNQDNPSKLVPIYDYHGNMWWPKQMTHQEILDYAQARQTTQSE